MSISLELYDGLVRLRERYRVSNSQLVAQAVWALIRGLIQVAPARSPYLIGLETNALRAILSDAEERAEWYLTSKQRAALVGLVKRAAARRAPGRPQRSRRLTAEQVIALREERAAGCGLRELGLQYGVSQTTALLIVRGERYRDIGGPLQPLNTAGLRPEDMQREAATMENTDG